MKSSPDTRESLILRLPSHGDVEAWEEFISIYEPFLFRFAQRRGLQEADAREIAQSVFLSVAGAIDRWRPDKEKGPFRAWLFRIARNHLLNFIAKNHRIRATGNSSAADILRGIAANDSQRDEWDEDYRKEMFRLAASQTRESVQSATWEAFWDTAVLGKSTEQVATRLHMTVGAVYIARCRVLAKIRKLIGEWESNDVL